MTQSAHLRYQDLIANSMWTALALHAAFCVFFALAGLDALALFNVGSIALYAFLATQVRKGRFTTTLLLTTAEVLVHAWFALSTLGFASGFQYYVFALVPGAFFHPNWHLRGKVGYLLGVCLAYIALERLFGTHPGLAVVAPDMLDYVRYFNTFAAFGFVAYVTEYYASVARKAEDELAYLATIDPLTGLFNRRHMLRMVDLELARLNRSGKPAALVMADLDDFKRINDRLGHECGDDALKRIADCLRQVRRGQDHVARWGGEEFLLLLPETDLAGAQVLAEKLRTQISGTPIQWQGETLNLTLTAAVTQLGRGEDFRKALSLADNALLQGKRDGKNCVVVAEPAGTA